MHHDLIVAPLPRRKTESTISLINVVFLMLIFFLISGTVAQPVDKDVTLVDTRDLLATPPPDALVLDAAGVLTYGGQPVSPDSLPGPLAPGPENDVIRIVPDRATPAPVLIALSADLRRLGFASVRIVTERGLE